MKNLFIFLFIMVIPFSFAKAQEGVGISLSHQELIPDGSGAFDQALYGTISDPLDQILPELEQDSRMTFHDMQGNYVTSSMGVYFGGDTLNIAWDMDYLEIGESYSVEVFFAVYNPGEEIPIWDIWMTDTVTVEDLSIVTSVANLDKPELSVYPNPTTDFVNVAGLDVDEEIFLFDSKGTKVLDQRANGLKRIDLSDLPSGLYVLRAVKDSEIRTLRFIKT